MVPTFGLTSEDCSLLFAFGQAGSLREAARLLGRDVSVVSRRLARIARIAPVLDKRRERWSLTPLGLEVNRWTAEAVRTQTSLLARPTGIRVGTTREFAARVVVPGWSDLFEEHAASPTLLTFEDGIEAALLESRVDVAFDCGRPRRPEIAFRVGVREPLTVCASAAFVRRHRIKSGDDLMKRPYLEYDRSPASRLLGLREELPAVAGLFNDIAVVRAAVLASLGWSLLPVYALQDELGDGSLVSFDEFTIPSEQFAVWWVRGNASATKWVSHALAWLRRRDLG